MTDMIENQKYPRTPHFEELRRNIATIARDCGATRIVIEEKLDGANAGMQFSEAGDMLTRSRGNFLQGGYREKQFDMFRSWADWLADDLIDRIEDRHIVYGEWMFARHSIHYDRLPHYFHEFDILDRRTSQFLSTPARRDMLDGLPITSVPILYEGPVTADLDLAAFIRPSVYRSPDWEASLHLAAEYAGVDPDRAVEEGDRSELAEGLYVKLETEELTVGRMKLVRPDFTQVIIDSGSHWADRPLIPNRLSPAAQMFMKPDEIMQMEADDELWRAGVDEMDLT